jgi:hypothetical protein
VVTGYFGTSIGIILQSKSCRRERGRLFGTSPGNNRGRRFSAPAHIDLHQCPRRARTKEPLIKSQTDSGCNSVVSRQLTPDFTVCCIVPGLMTEKRIGIRDPELATEE